MRLLVPEAWIEKRLRNDCFQKYPVAAEGRVADFRQGLSSARSGHSR
jgi:hypothetical protein